MRTRCGPDVYQLRNRRVSNAYRMHTKCVPNACYMRTRCVPDPYQVRTRSVPDACQMRARCVLDAYQAGRDRPLGRTRPGWTRPGRNRQCATVAGGRIRARGGRAITSARARRAGKAGCSAGSAGERSSGAAGSEVSGCNSWRIPGPPIVSKEASIQGISSS